MTSSIKEPHNMTTLSHTLPRKNYLRALHDIYYTANQSDTETCQGWQKPGDCQDHCYSIQLILRDMLTEHEQQLFSDCLGDFDAFWDAIQHHE
jgi:hypothetical protein